MRKRFLVVHNPVAGMQRRWMLRSVCQILRERGAALSIVRANALETDIRLASEAVRTGEFDAVVAANVLHLVPNLPGAIEALRKVTKPGGLLVAPTFCHDQTRVSWLVSRLLSLSGFPGQRRFTLASLLEALELNDMHVTQSETLAGLIPVGFVSAVFGVQQSDGHDSARAQS